MYYYVAASFHPYRHILDYPIPQVNISTRARLNRRHTILAANICLLLFSNYE